MVRHRDGHVRSALLSSRTRCALLLGLMLITCLTVSRSLNSAESAGQQADRTSGRTVDALLKQFVSECVQITPGSGDFPSSFTFGPVSGDEVTTLKPAEIQMSAPFRISRFETTQQLYEAVMGRNPSRWKGPRNSVEYVSFDDANQFCQRLTQSLRQQDLITATEVVRLPTEIEWEYCCRAGTDSLFSFPTSNDDPWQQHAECDRYAWHTGNAAGNDPPVGALAPNPWGLYDMHGYLWEMTADAPQPSTANDRAAAYLKTIRGGSWRDEMGLLTCATRLMLPTHAVSDAIGFRCVIASE